MSNSESPKGLLKKIARVFGDRWRYWHPRVADPEWTRTELSHFYATRTDYHAMTAGPDKINHPQVRLLLKLLSPDDVCVEFGCGGGVVLVAAAQRVKRVIGLDIAPLGLAKAGKHGLPASKMLLAQADVARVPLRSASANAVYSLEVLEHVWNPENVMLEMLRVLRPGGLFFMTTPNGYSLDLHLRKRGTLKTLDHVGAISVCLAGQWWRSAYQNMQPDLHADPVYPDCDMITKLFPASLRRFLENHGCAVERLETFFFQQAKAPDEAARQRYEQLDRHVFYRHFGDHILVVGRKRT